MHFTTTYDIFKYNGKCPRTDIESFNKIRGNHMYETYARHFVSAKEAGKLCLANFAYRDPKWLYEGYPLAQECLLEWQKTMANINMIVEKDIRTLPPNPFVKTPKGNTPPVLQLYYANKISPETCILLDCSIPYIDRLHGELDSDPVAVQALTRLTKYRPFVTMKWTEQIQHIIKEDHGKPRISN